LRAKLSANWLGEDLAKDLTTESEGLRDGKRPERDEQLLVLTFEKLSIVKPRGFLIPVNTVLAVLSNIDVWWKAAKNTSEGATRRTVRLIEMAVSFIYRYPEYFKLRSDTAIGREAFQKAKRIADEIFPKDSQCFLDDYLADNRKKLRNYIKRGEAEAIVFETWFRTKDSVKWNKFLAFDRGVTAFNDILEKYQKLHIPPWFAVMYTPRKKD
jgi:hypothetical protein